MFWSNRWVDLHDWTCVFTEHAAHCWHQSGLFCICADLGTEMSGKKGGRREDWYSSEGRWNAVSSSSALLPWCQSSKRHIYLQMLGLWNRHHTFRGPRGVPEESRTVWGDSGALGRTCRHSFTAEEKRFDLAVFNKWWTLQGYNKMQSPITTWKMMVDAALPSEEWQSTNTPSRGWTSQQRSSWTGWNVWLSPTQTFWAAGARLWVKSQR